MAGNIGPAPSIFTMLAPPSASIGVAASSARSGVAQLWKGMSATSSADASPRDTAAQW